MKLNADKCVDGHVDIKLGRDKILESNNVKLLDAKIDNKLNIFLIYS